METRRVQVADQATGQLAAIDVDNDRFEEIYRSLEPAKHRLFGGSAGGEFNKRSAKDANEAFYFNVSQLAYTEAVVLETQYQKMQFRDIVPVSAEAGDYADSVRTETVDRAGKGKRVSGRGHDLPRVDVGYGEQTVPIVQGGIAYDYTVDELRKSAFLRRPLPTARMQAGIEACERHLNDVALYGETESNLTGLFNNGSVPHGNAPTGGWGTATEAQIIADVNAGILQVWNASGFNDAPTDLVLAPGAFTELQRPRSTNSDKSILQWLLENNLAKTMGKTFNIVPGYGLDTGGASSTRRGVFYVKNPLYVVFHNPLPLRFLAPQLEGLVVTVPGEYKYSSTAIKRVKSAYYMDNL